MARNAQLDLSDTHSAATDAWDEDYDSVILGAGGGGMNAALVSAIEGMRTLLIEKSEWIGGTAASSSGTVDAGWHGTAPAGITNDAAWARTYLNGLAGVRADPGHTDRF